MTLSRNILKTLDRRGGRSVLASYATWHARRTTNRDITVLFDDVWMHKIDGRYWADSPTFTYHRKLASKWARYALNEDLWARDFWFHVYKPKPGDVIVDIGAGTGTDLPVFAEAVGAEGKVIAVEAHPATYGLLEAAVRLNQLTNVTCVQRAILDSVGTVTISDVDKHVGNTVSKSGADTGIVVHGCTLTELCDELGIEKIDFLKMNIEGAENYAIHGMADMMPRIGHLCIACHDFRADRGEGDEYRSRVNILRFLESHRFEIHLRDDADSPATRDHIHAVGVK